MSKYGLDGLDEGLQWGSRLARFSKERFDPVSHLLLIGLFLAAHVSFFSVQGEPVRSPWVIVFLFLGTIAFFFKLRLYDEIKDYEVDLEHNPSRPLARGLVTHRDLYWGIVICIGVELFCFGPKILVAVLYSLLMYREFFIGPFLRKHLTTYAVSHTVVSVFLSAAILSVLSRQSYFGMSKEYWIFSLNSWFLFNVFEFGRKTFAASEERAGVESYSKIFGRAGAFCLVMGMAVLSSFVLVFLLQSRGIFFEVFAISALGSLSLVGAAFVWLNRPSVATFYRGFSSAYILIVYLGVVLRSL